MSKVCVTGASGYIGSWLVKKLLEKGHLVHATIRNLGNKSKTDHLKSLHGADARLLLFEADIYDSAAFAPAIQGCEFVFLVATPYQHNPQSSKVKPLKEHDRYLSSLLLLPKSKVIAFEFTLHKLGAKLAGWKVRTLSFADTGSVTAASPLREDSTSFKNFIDESYWTPLNISYSHSEDSEKDYISSKTLAEKEILSYNDDEEKRKFEVVSLTCGLVGGDTVLPFVPASLQLIVSPLRGVQVKHKRLKFLQALVGCLLLVHIEDVTEAHAFCMEKDSMAGRFLCATAYPTMQEVVDYLAKNFPENIMIKEVVGEGVGVQSSSQKLVDLGFKYKYGVGQIMDESIECCKRFGALQF